MRELGMALLAAALAGNVLSDRLVVPGAAVGFTRDRGVIRDHLLAFLLALVPSLWISWVASSYLLFLGRLSWIAFLGAAGLVVLGERAVFLQGLHQERVASHLALLPANCAFIGTILVVLSEPQGFLLTTAKGLGATLGYGLVLVVLTTLRTKLRGSPIPKSLAGLPSVLILLGLISMVLLGFAQAFHLYP